MIERDLPPEPAEADESRRDDVEDDPQAIPAEQTAEGLDDVSIGGEGQDDAPGGGARRS